MNIAIFGGAFNPVHNGHLHLLKTLTLMTPDMTKYDKIIIIPTADPPHKSSQGLISGEHRINMLNLALFDNDDCEKDFLSKIEISDIELNSKGKSYTYYTLKKLKKLYPDDKLYLLIGSDQLFYFKNWYKYKKILSLAEVYAITRNEKEREAVSKYLTETKADFNGRVSAMVAKPVVVSSTEIRELVKEGKSISHLVPLSVERYIKENNLYV